MFEKADQVIAAARACIGTPFRHQGRTPGVGLDCAGTCIIAAYNGAGIVIKDFSGYPTEPFSGMLKEMFDAQKHLKKIKKNEMAPGDILLMRISEAPQHVAMLSYDGYIIHAYGRVGKVVEQRLDDLWKLRILFVYRFCL